MGTHIFFHLPAVHNLDERNAMPFHDAVRGSVRVGALNVGIRILPTQKTLEIEDRAGWMLGGTILGSVSI